MASLRLNEERHRIVFFFLSAIDKSKKSGRLGQSDMTSKSQNEGNDKRNERCDAFLLFTKNKTKFQECRSKK